MGKKLGELTKKDAVEFVHTALELVQGSDPKRFSNEQLDAAWKAIAPHTDPRFKEELRGLAAGTGLTMDDLHRAQALPVLSDYACSSIAAWGKATKDGHLYQTRNLDWELHITAQDHPLIVVYIPNEGIPHANITFAGCIGANTGMNAKGIVLSEMGDSSGQRVSRTTSTARISRRCFARCCTTPTASTRRSTSSSRPTGSRNITSSSATERIRRPSRCWPMPRTW